MVDILGVEEEKAREIYEAVHRETFSLKWPRLTAHGHEQNFKELNGNENDDQNYGAQGARSQSGEARRFR